MVNQGHGTIHPIIFPQHASDFEDLVRTIVTMLDPDEQDRLREMEEWIIKGEGTWVLSESFNTFLGTNHM